MKIYDTYQFEKLNINAISSSDLPELPQNNFISSFIMSIKFVEADSDGTPFNDIHDFIEEFKKQKDVVILRHLKFDRNVCLIIFTKHEYLELLNEINKKYFFMNYVLLASDIPKHSMLNYIYHLDVDQRNDLCDGDYNNISHIFVAPEIIDEKMQITPINTIDLSNVSIHKFFPKTTSELIEMISDHYCQFGPNPDLNDIDVSKITDMSNLFSNDHFCYFHGDISKWDVSNVENMSHMFEKNRTFNGDLSKWDVSNVKDMSYMFKESDSFNGNISVWNTKNVTNMNHMFYLAKNFNQDISNWNISKLKNMTFMFVGAKSFDQDLSKWDARNAVSYNFVFDDACPLGNNEKFWPKFPKFYI